MIRPSVSLSVLLACAALTCGVFSQGPVLAAPEQAESPVAEWDKRWDKVLQDSAKEYVKLAKKYEEKLEASSAYIRRFVLRYLPDDEETRKYLGYVRGKDGRWERVDTRADEIRELTDLDDPKATRFGKDRTEAEKRIAASFRGLAKKAAENAAAKDAAADAKWTEKAQRAWERVLEALESVDTPANKEAEEAHKALGHRKFEGRYCSDLKFKYVKARSDRQRIGQKQAAAVIKPVDPVEPDGNFAKAGLVGGGARSAHFVVNATHGKEVAIRLAGSAEKALNDVIEIYGFAESAKDQVSVKLHFIKDEDEYRKLMEKGYDWRPSEVTRRIEFRLTGGVFLEGGDVMLTSGNRDADDSAMNIATQHLLRPVKNLAMSDIGGTAGGIDDWLWQSIGYDVTKRVNGSADTHWGTFGRYGEAVEPRPGEDKWVELARRLVQTDDDVPLRNFPRLKLENKDFKAPHLIKGWALIQFLFEKDTEKARKFVWIALANGTVNAILAVYPNDAEAPDPEKSMDLLDAEYREWILKAW